MDTPPRNWKAIRIASIALHAPLWLIVRAMMEDDFSSPPEWHFPLVLIGFSMFGVIGWSTLDGGKDWSAPRWDVDPFDNHQPLQGLHMGAWGFIAGAVALLIAGQSETPVDWAWVLPGCIGAGILAGVRVVAIPPHREPR
jgi:hypothetical protein